MLSPLAPDEQRVGLTFHRTFPLNTPSISKILAVSSETQGRTNASEIRESTGLGTIYVEAMPRYARACGLIEMKNYQLTRLGELVYRHDPHLMHPITLWLMHYHISAPQGPGPAFWSHLVTRFLPFGDKIAAADIVTEIAGFLDHQHDDQTFQARTVRSTATVFVRTYAKTDGLGRLGLLNEVQGRDGWVQVSDPQSPPLSVVAYALADYWAAYYGDQQTVSLSELARDSGFGRAMWMDNRRLNEALDALRIEGVLDLYRIAPPYQVARRWSAKADLLAHLYQ